MAVTTSTSERSLESPTRFGAAEGESGAAKGHSTGIGPVDKQRASEAVALAFAAIVSRRYQGTSWLPVKRSGSNDSFVMATGKVVRLLSGPTDAHAQTGVGHPAASATDSRAPHENGADPCT
jgi:hypothetical protein